MAKTNITAIAVIILALNFNITNELTIRNTETNTNKQTRFNKNNILIYLNKDKYNVENTNIDMKKYEDDKETENNDSYKLYENKAEAVDSNNPDIKIQDANENIFNKTTAKRHKNEEHTVKATLKREAVKQNRVKRDTDDDIIVWDYCEGKKHLEYIDGRFQCVDMSFDSRNSFGTLVKCPSNTRRVILNAQVVMCQPKRHRV